MSEICSCGCKKFKKALFSSRNTSLLECCVTPESLTPVLQCFECQKLIATQCPKCRGRWDVFDNSFKVGDRINGQFIPSQNAEIVGQVVECSNCKCTYDKDQLLECYEKLEQLQSP